MRLTPLVEALKEFILGHGVIHADETPVSLLAPGRGKTKRAYVWVYRTTNFAAQRAVYYDFCKDRSGEHPQRVLADFGGTLVSDDYAGYHALHRRGVSAALCWAHARRKLFEAHEFNGSEIAGQAVALIARLYEIEREARELGADARQRLRQQRSKPIIDALHTWLVAKRQALAKADVTAKAIDYSLSNWTALSRFLDDGHVPIDNNAAENSVRPLAVGRPQLVVRRFAAGRRACRCGPEPDRVGQTQRPRSLGLPQGRLRAAAHAEEPRPRAASASQLAGLDNRRRRRAACGDARRRRRVALPQHVVFNDARVSFAERLPCTCRMCCCKV